MSDHLTTFRDWCDREGTGPSPSLECCRSVLAEVDRLREQAFCLWLLALQDESVQSRFINYYRPLPSADGIRDMDVIDFVGIQSSNHSSGKLTEALDAIWEAGAKDWDNIDDPDSYIKEIRGDE